MAKCKPKPTCSLSSFKCWLVVDLCCFDMHITFYFVDYFFELMWECKEGFNMCYSCKIDLGCNEHDPRGLGFDSSLGLQNLK